MQTSDLYHHFLAQLQPLLNAQQSCFSVALSGGVDSVVLLHLMKQAQQQHLELKLEAVYVNHGLSKYADEWQGFCQSLCEELDVAFKAVHVEIYERSRTSLEAQAREARYQALDENCISGSVILLGQHLNDQLETFLLRLKRGSGLQGLASMPQTRLLASGRVCFRPMINITREQIEQFASEFAITHITDDSNVDERFDRNFLRHQVLPILMERFQGFEKSAARSIRLLQKQQSLLDEYTQNDLTHCQNKQGGLSCEAIAGFSKPRQANLIRAWLNQFTHQLPSENQLQQIIEQGLTAKADAQIKICLQSGDVRRHQQHWYFVKEQAIPEAMDITLQSVELIGGRKLIVKAGKGIRKPRQDEQVRVEFNKPQARIKPLHKPGSNTLKHWFKDAKVAPWLRAQTPLIFYNDQLVQVVGYFISEQHSVEDGILWETIYE
ncbi:tRNA lysidine(34) synthetase TilS [Pseudoalteromonas shioyasakiensis]|uniref:tRNA(Ile)-lysidine synthase n=1 Tax=Pseudoalteromonas shioyasakiensis TaxID=1190813 RepID=A0ABT6U3H7_9GAMM|nr:MULTISPECIES: tRNA lysidine(34) synthetase TilS [Pseudoalteromonas]MDI4669785.1 tRNA lysidine(34) synthetase TilS [Pseudoalteromonas shioyasakiensis]MDI4674630.1 tRNA lysidine(34) synthetase TilS [Pseudoalteromonas shioyasakiensis]MDI4686700.1 tRNA lysidine(34) synthetase TilS [Pseudoalteromonas shioyasakiensis]MDI4705295.1 tRNA lysidine(34) synthetase TilS [Pseudoalteromonas shioyasakiensis]NUJ21748.1 tRNA lysidine(34) synthetase TilS [Pseudoalteromonas sp. 0802]